MTALDTLGFILFTLNPTRSGFLKTLFRNDGYKTKLLLKDSELITEASMSMLICQGY